MAAKSLLSRCNFVGLALGLAISALLLGIWVSSGRQPPRPEFKPLSATLVPHATPLQPFTLTDTRGGTLSPASLAGHWSLLSFGYTHCPDVCPTTLAVMNSVAQKLREKNIEPRIQMIFVSVDPERDDLDKLREYLAYFNPDFLGATGDHQALARFTSQIGVFFQRTDDQVQTALGYLVDHTAHLVLLDPQVRMHALFGGPHIPDRIAADLEGILANQATERQ